MENPEPTEHEDEQAATERQEDEESMRGAREPDQETPQSEDDVDDA
jgi:hypothetical protein